MVWQTPPTFVTLATLDAPALNILSDDLTVLSTHQHSGVAGDGAGLFFPPWANNQLISHRVRLGRTYAAGGSGNSSGAEEQIRASGVTFDVTAVKDTVNNWPCVNWALTGNGYLSNELLVYVDSELTPTVDLLWAHVSTADTTVRLGLMLPATTGFSADQTEGAFFRVATTGNWFAVCRNGGSETAQDTLIPWSATPKHYRVQFVTSGRVKFFIDSVEVADIATANVPAVDTLLAAGWGVNHPAAGTVSARTGLYMGLSHKVKSS